MLDLPITRWLKPALLASALFLLACSPKYDWREVRGAGAPFMVMLPAKPASHARPINLGGTQVTMTMTAAEVDGVSFAVGTAEMPDASQAQKALAAMKTALVKNIGGTIKQEKSSPAGTAPTVIEVEASGASGNGQSRLLLARFVAKEQRIYQVVVVGPEQAVSREAADTFFTSFKPG